MGGSPTPETASDIKSRVFLSYSRADKDFTRRLAGALVARGFLADFDQSDYDPASIETGIAADEEWWRRLQDLIAAADAMVFVVSPESARSKVCNEEIVYARSLGKRVVPVLLRSIDFATAPPRLAALNMKISFEQPSDFDASLTALSAVLGTDILWHREGARLMALAVKWDADGRPHSQLMPMGAVLEAERWMALRPASAPQPGEPLVLFLSTSAERAKGERDHLLATTGRAFVQPGEQALAEERYDAAMRLAAAGAILGDDLDMRLAPELAGVALRAVGASRFGSVMRGHKGPAHAVVFSPDGARVASTGADRTGRVWDVTSGSELAVLGDHKDGLFFVEFSPDGAYLVTLSSDVARIWDFPDGRKREFCTINQGAVKGCGFRDGDVLVVTTDGEHVAHVWRAADKREIATLRGHTNRISHAIFTLDGTRLLTTSIDRTARLWDGSGRKLATLQASKSGFSNVMFSRDGRRILTIDGGQKSLSVWDAAAGRLLSEMQAEGGDVYRAALNADGSRAVTSSLNDTAWVWDTTTGRALVALRGHVGQVFGVAFNLDGSRIVTTGVDHTARIWDAETGRQLMLLRGHENSLTRATFSRDGARVATASDDGTVRVWDVATREIFALRGHEASVASVSFSPDGSRILSAGDRAARIWDCTTGRQVAAFQHEHRVDTAAFAKGGLHVVTLCNDNNTARLLNTVGKEIAQFPDVFALAVSPDGASLVTGGGKATRAWDANDGRMLCSLEGHQGLVTSASFNADGTRIVTTSDDETTRVWNAADGREIAVLKYPRPRVPSGRTVIIKRSEESDISGAVLTADGARVVTFCASHPTVRIWDVASGRQVAALLHGDDRVHDATFSPDGRRVATAAKCARLWDAEAGKLIAELHGHARSVYRIAYSADGERLVTASFDGTARVWDTDRGCELAVLRADTQSVACASFSPDGNRVASGSDDHVVRLWDVEDTRHLVGDVAEVLAAALTGGRGVRAKAERGSIPMKSLRDEDDDLFQALASRLEQRNAGAAQRIAARAEHLRHPRHPNCYGAGVAEATLKNEAPVSTEPPRRIDDARTTPKTVAGSAKPRPALQVLRAIWSVLLWTGLVVAGVVALAHFGVLPPP